MVISLVDLSGIQQTGELFLDFSSSESKTVQDSDWVRFNQVRDFP